MDDYYMGVRTITGAILVIILIGLICFLPVFAMPFAVGAMAVGGVYELLHTTGFLKGHTAIIVISASIAFFVPAWVYFSEPSTPAVAVTLLFVMYLFVSSMTGKTKIRFEYICIAVFAALIIPYLYSSLIRLLGLGKGNAAMGRTLVWVPFISSFASDVFAYLIGRKFGKNKLCPEISPKKTVEGSVAGLIAAPIILSLYLYITGRWLGFDVNYLSAVATGIAAAFAGQIGDLSMSLIKRQVGIKDYSNIMPGHGGILDRFDSLLFAAPICELVLSLIPCFI